MKKSFLITFAVALLALVACGDNSSKKGNATPQDLTESNPFGYDAEAPEGEDNITDSKVEDNITETDSAESTVDTEAIDVNAGEPDHIEISKETLTLKVYDKYGRLISKYPIAAGRVYGKKQANGDLKSPEGELFIGVIQDASRWTTLDNNGKSVKGARGNWFMHLDGGEVRGVGICGTLDPSIVGSRSTDGNIVLRNEDLNELKTLVHSNMRVTILPSNADLKADGIVPKAEEKKPSSNTTPAESKKENKKSNAAVTDGNGDVWHTIAKGEVLSNIAAKYNTTVAKIKALNPGINVDRIREGQRIKVYGAAEATTTAVTKKSEEKKEAPAGEVWHTIAKGEVLSKVASKYGTTLAKIKSLNPGINVDRIREGQKIRVK